LDSRRPHLVAALCLSLLLAMPAAASAAGWLAPVVIQPASTAPSGTSKATTASNAAGAQAFTWNDNMTNSDGGAVCLHGEVVSRTSGGALSPSKETGCNVVLAVGPSDQVVAVWSSGQYGVLYAATGTAGQVLSDPVIVSSPGHGVWFPVIRFDPSGTPTIAWGEERASAPTYTVRTATRQPDGSWSVSGELGYSESEQPAPDLAFGPNGDAVLAFNSTASSNYYVQTLYRAAGGGSWGGAQSVYGPLSSSAGYLDAGPRVRFDPQGRATVMEPVQASLAPRTELFTWTRATNGTWSQQSVPNSVNTTAQAGLPYGDMEFDSAGNGVVAFMYGITYPYSLNVRVATRTPGTTQWSSDLVELEPANFGYFPSTPDVAFDAHDNATIAYSYNKTLHVFSRPAGAGSFSPQPLPPGISGSSPSITSDANGYLIATWTDASGLTNTSVYDPVPPTLDTADAPAGGTAGSPVTFTVGGSDVWGPVSYAIDFGDGQPAATGRVAANPRTPPLARATGSGVVAHIYPQPGTYTVTMGVTDGAANTTTTTRTVNVGAAPAAGPLQLAPVAGLPDPVVGRTVNLATVTPVVLVKEPGAKTFVQLVAPKQVRVGSIVDARKGRVRITIADGRGKLWTADFYRGMFTIRQLTKPGSLAVLQLYGGKFKGCPRAPKAVLFTRRKQSPSRTVRQLWGSGSGPFRTVGRFASATIRGTTWLTADRCNATLVRVTTGKVAVRDFARKRTIILKAPKRYLARPARRR
jgi:hypothetical protein